jgi:hypothetical protein
MRPRDDVARRCGLVGFLRTEALAARALELGGYDIMTAGPAHHGAVICAVMRGSVRATNPRAYGSAMRSLGYVGGKTRKTTYRSLTFEISDSVNYGVRKRDRGNTPMKTFIVACIAAIAIAAVGGVVLSGIQTPAETAFSTTGVRL